MSSLFLLQIRGFLSLSFSVILGEVTEIWPSGIVEYGCNSYVFRYSISVT